MTDVVVDELNLPDELPETFYYRKANAHQIPEVRAFADQFVRLHPDAELIGDTIFCTNIPHPPHIDCCKFEGYKSWVSVLVPLYIDTDERLSFFTSEQRYESTTATFRKGCEQFDEHLPETQRKKDVGIEILYDYSEIENIQEKGLDREWYLENFDFWDEPNDYWFPSSLFEGFTIERDCHWKPGNMVMFDSYRIHFGQNIAKKGATKKIGMNLNFGLPI